jgi:outer membrane biosynthesis protein TonB
MAPLESLPPDQRAVLQLVLQRGRTYDEIAAMLSIDRAAVRDRALSAFDTIGPPTRVSPERRALITDYMMGQLPPKIADQIFERLKTSPAERAWARALASDLSTLSRGSLPDIPSSVGSSAPAAPRAPAEPEPPAEPKRPAAPEPAVPTVVDSGEDADEAPAPRPRRRPAAQPAGTRALAEQPEEDEDDSGYGRRDDAADRDTLPVSRRGGAIFIFGGVLAAAAILVVAIILLNNGGSSKSPSAPVAASTSTSASTGAATPTAATSTPASTSTAATSTPTGTSTSSPAAAGGTGASGTTGAQVVAQLDLKAPSGATSPVGVAQIVKQAGKEGLVLVATGVTPNTKHDAYAVWLYASPSHAHLLGFVNPAVGSTGRLETEGLLPANAASYRELLVTRETQSKPSAPGTIVLRGALTIK